MITPQQFDPNAGTAGYDNFPAYSAAIAACPPGGEIFTPATGNKYLLSSGLTFTKPVNFICEGDAVEFTGDIGGTDLLHCALPAGQTLRDWSFKGVRSSCANARSLLHIDTTAAANTYLPGLIVEDFINTVSPLMYAVWVDGLPNGAGLSQALFNRCQFTVDGASPNAAFMFNNVGDSIRVRDGQVTGTAYGLWLNQVPGAGGFSLDGLNGTALGGIVIQRATKPILKDFELELSNFDNIRQVPNSGKVSSGAAIYIMSCDGATIGPGQIQAIAGCSNFNEAIYCGAGANIDVNQLRLASTVGGIGINRGTSTGTVIDAATTYSGFATNVV